MNNHAQINSTFYEDDFDFNAERNITYPVANFEWLESDVSGKVTTHAYQVTLADLVDESIKGHEDEIFSDLMLVANDFLSWAEESYDFIFTPSVNINKFSDDGDDRTAGIVFKLNLATIRSQGECTTPTLQ